MLQFMATTINILSGVGFATFLMHFAMSQLWPKYPFKGFKKGFFVFLFLLGVYGFVRILVKGY